jgi:hypothetical protein
MQFPVIAAVALLLPALCTAQSLKSSNHLFAATISNTPDAPALITITDSLYDNLHLDEMGLERAIFYQAYKGYLVLASKNKLHNMDVLSIADYSQSCNNKRLYVIDLVGMQVLYQTYVSHGKNSGNEFANAFSNEKDSNKSSIGFMVTAEVYYGNYGTALRLDGVEAGINDHVRQRDIVLHGSNFVNDKIIGQRGKIGRSLGCPAVPMAGHTGIIEHIKNGSCFFVYHPNQTYAKRSKIINTQPHWPSVSTIDVDATTAKAGSESYTQTQGEEAYAAGLE